MTDTFGNDTTTANEPMVIDEPAVVADDISVDKEAPPADQPWWLKSRPISNALLCAAAIAVAGASAISGKTNTSTIPPAGVTPTLAAPATSSPVVDSAPPAPSR